MKQTGIIMSGDHPLKCLDGTKAQTRRTYGLGKINKEPDIWGPPVVFEDGYARFFTPNGEGDETIHCPYNGVGDRLWVRETYHFYHRLGLQANIRYYSDNFVTWVHLPKEAKTPRVGVHPSIHMPRWASRILLEITEIRVERVQDITKEDAKAEGVPCSTILPDGRRLTSTYRYFFRQLWDSLNAKRGYGWDANPWVWCITFKKEG